MSSGFFHHNTLDWSISNKRGAWLVFHYHVFIEIPVFNANSVESDQTPRSASTLFGNVPFMLIKTKRASILTSVN